MHNGYGDYIPLIFGIITPIIGIVKNGGEIVIKFDKLWDTMNKKGVTTYQLREQCGIDSKTIRRLKANDNIETKTLNKLCTVLKCDLSDIAEFVADE
jgi:DNA-binding Xre family transcriptional regulator